MAGAKYKLRGKCTFYIPTDTPQYVLDYLNERGDKGTLSRDIISLVREYLDGSAESPGIPAPKLVPDIAVSVEDNQDQQSENQEYLLSVYEQTKRFRTSKT